MSHLLRPPLRARGSEHSIILDCDGVLLDWISGFRTFAEARLGRQLCVDGPKDFDLHQWLGLTDLASALDLIREFHGGADGAFGKLDPLPGVAQALTSLKAQGRNLHLITACSTDADVIAMRRDNLISAFGDIFDDMHFVGMRDSKLPLLLEYREAVWVEDKFENALAGIEAGHRSYLIRASHNIDREPTCVHRSLRWVNGVSDVAAFELAV